MVILIATVTILDSIKNKERRCYYVGSTGGFWKPTQWSIDLYPQYIGTAIHPYFPNEDLFRVKMGEGEDDPDGVFNIDYFMPRTVYEKTKSGEYIFVKNGIGIFANWKIIDNQENIICQKL